MYFMFIYLKVECRHLVQVLQFVGATSFITVFAMTVGDEVSQCIYLKP